MFALNGHRTPLPGLIFALIDCLLTLAGIFGGIFIRFSNDMDSFFMGQYLAGRIMLVVFLIHMGFYLFDLYDPKLYEERKKMFLVLLKSCGTSSILIFTIYYLIPSLEIGRGVFGMSLVLIFILNFFWRLLYVRMFKSKAFNERVLIIGTGALAKKVGEEITNHGYHGFEIVGFIDENADKTGERISERI